MRHPIPENFDLKKFLDAVRDLDHLEIFSLCVGETDYVDRISTKVKGAVEARKRGSLKYKSQISQFGFFIQNGKKPFGVSESDFLLYRPIVEKLVQKGAWKPEALKLFEK